jgi:hypothetical protein
MNRPTMSEPPHHTGFFLTIHITTPLGIILHLAQPTYNMNKTMNLLHLLMCLDFLMTTHMYQALYPAELTNSDPSPATLNPLFHEIDAMAKPQSHTPQVSDDPYLEYSSLLKNKLDKPKRFPSVHDNHPSDLDPYGQY